MRVNELTKFLLKNGITLKREGGRHDLYYSPLTHNTFPYPAIITREEGGLYSVCFPDLESYVSSCDGSCMRIVPVRVDTDEYARQYCRCEEE